MSLEKAREALRLLADQLPVGPNCRCQICNGIREALAALDAPPAESGELVERIAQQLYARSTDNDPIVHTNRFPAWSELAESAKDKWRVAAALRAAEGSEPG